MHENPQPAPLLAPEALTDLLADPGADLLLLDCRFDLGDPGAGARAHAAGHIPGSRHLPLEPDLAAPHQPGRTGRHPLPDPATLAARLGDLGAGPDTLLVAWDSGNGAFAARLWWLARWLGHARVTVLDGGAAAWQTTGGAWGTATTTRPARGPLPRRASLTSTVASPAVPALAAKGCLLDARAPERFRGEVEPLDPVAGHIPGARNLPFTTLLDPASGRFLAPAALHRALTDAGLRPAAAAAATCGSGVTACHLILAAVAAGLPEPALYPDAWSGWITDSRRPVATG